MSLEYYLLYLYALKSSLTSSNTFDYPWLYFDFPFDNLILITKHRIIQTKNIV